MNLGHEIDPKRGLPAGAGAKCSHVRPAVSLALEERRRAALLTGAVARYAPLRFRLCVESRMADQLGKDRWSRGHREGVGWRRLRLSGVVRAMFKRSMPGWSLIGQKATATHTHRTVVFTIAAAAGRQIRLTRRGRGDERCKQRHSEDCQQRNGENFSQYLHSSTRTPGEANRPISG